MPTSQDATLHALLWESGEACAARRRKAATALAAITGVLRDHAPLGGGEREFIDLVGRLEVEAPEAIQAVWATPQAYVWVRRAYELVRGAMQRRDPAREPPGPPTAALAAHLDSFKRFALAAAARGRLDLLFERPFVAPLPLDLPDTPWSLAGAQPVATIVGIAAGGLLLRHEGREVHVPLAAAGTAADPPFVLHACPVVDHAGCRIFLKPDAFREPGLAGAAAPVEAGLAFHRSHEPLVHAAVQAIHRHDPESFAQLRDDIAIIGLKPPGAGDYGNTSMSRMPGAFVTSTVGNPLALADDLIHETYHNRLFALEEQGPFFAGDEARRDARHYSPWRDDPRPIFGVFHAFYVFTRVLRFWRLVHVDLEREPRSVGPEHRGYVLDRILRLRGQLAMARETLRSADGLTPWGVDVIASIEREFERECGLLDALALPADTPALAVAADGSYHAQAGGDGRPLSVREALHEHRAGFDRRQAQPRRSR